MLKSHANAWLFFISKKTPYLIFSYLVFSIPNKMKSTVQLFTFIALVLLLTACHKKQKHTSNDHPKNPAYVSFSLGETTLPNSGSTTLTLFGCNTNLMNTDTTLWHGPQRFQWKKSNQVLSGVPYGSRYDSVSKKPYYISKYYIASPPIIKFDQTNSINENTLYDIGLVTPDEFQFDGKAPAQMVYLDYSILKPMHVTYFNIDFGDIDRYIPFRVECSNFPWIDSDQIQNAQGGSGIGSLKKGTHQDQLFLPYYFEEVSTSYEATEKKKIMLNTKVTLLNDILLNEKIFFLVGKDSLETINLNSIYNPNAKGQTLKLIAIPREATDIPDGCKKPKTGLGPYEK